ncbi:hypothetical protein KIN20_007053 [Parelaphostrongylus tenuis]|uniref:Uncharacterized protein n=1 Tax=Parelaphostrongylus tenuis TaxID=148309 RepID=A0AAD5QHI8_PARTN|nr:hypothetical protein KIN20_007053 [Parelaphostrongylus tenuis]
MFQPYHYNEQCSVNGTDLGNGALGSTEAPGKLFHYSFDIVEGERDDVELNTALSESTLICSGLPMVSTHDFLLLVIANYLSEVHAKARNAEMLSLLIGQLQHVTALSRMTLYSRFMLVRAIVNAHSILEQIETTIKKASDEIFNIFLAIEEQIQDEINCDLEQQEVVDETLLPVLRKCRLIEQLRASIAPLIEGVRFNDSTTNILRMNTRLVKQLLTKMSDMDVVQRTTTHSLEDVVETNNYVAEVISSMSSIRNTLELVDRFLSRSEAFRSLKMTMDAQTHGIARLFLDRFPSHSINNYRIFNGPLSSEEYDAEDLDEKDYVMPSVDRRLRLEPWTSASELSIIRSSSMSSSREFSVGDISEITKSFDVDNCEEFYYDACKT